MIFDSIDNISQYPLLKSLQKFKVSEYRKGKFDFGSSLAFGIGLEYETKPDSQGLWEAHRKYVDIHLILAGVEKVQVSNIDHCAPTNDFDEQNDYQLFNAQPEQEIILKKGDFLALFQNEVHKTGVQKEGPTTIKKVVFKLEL